MRRSGIFVSIFILLLPFLAHGEADTISISNLKSGIDFSKSWRFANGDDRRWASPSFDDSGWMKTTGKDFGDSADIVKHFGIVWYRAGFYIDSLVDGTPLALRIYVMGAIDVFVDGHLVRSIGKVGNSAREEVSGFTTQPTIVAIPFNNKGYHLIAIRSSNFSMASKLKKLNINGIRRNFQIRIVTVKDAIDELNDITDKLIPIFFSGVFIILSLFHFILFLYYRKNRSNLYYSLFTFFLFAIFFAVYSSLSGVDYQTTITLIEVIVASAFIAPLFFLGILYEIFYSRLLKRFWIFCAILFSAIALFFFLDKKSWTVIPLLIYSPVVLFETLRVIINAVSKRKPGAFVFVLGLIFPIPGTFALTFLSFLLGKLGFTVVAETISGYILEFLGYGFLMSVSISMTIYLGRDFARMNKKLREQLQENKVLFEKTIEQEKEKKKILENQKEELEKMVTLRTEEVVRQKAELEVKNKDILDNLLYARRIQDAILPEIRLIYRVLGDSFIMYLPKDIVSGDFYSFSQKDDKVILAAADCTGHGVTGAFMSMIGSSMLNQIVNEKGITTPSEILNQLNNGIAEALKQTANDVNDGMDICLCTIDLKSKKLEYAGANRPLWLIRDERFEIVRPDKSAIGGFHLEKETFFTNHNIELKNGDCIYLFTDGYADQFGGPENKKILSKRFREMLSSIHHLPMREQETALLTFFNNWKGNETQVDDVLVIGIRI